MGSASLTSGGGTWTITPTDNATTVIDPNNHSWEYGRDASRRIHYLKEPGGATTTYDYDDDGRLISVTRPLGDRTTYDYAPPEGDDRRAMLNVETATEYPRTGSDEAAANQTRVTRIGYGPANLPTSITTPDGATTLIKRDERGNPQSTTDPVGVTTTTLLRRARIAENLLRSAHGGCDLRLRPNRRTEGLSPQRQPPTGRQPTESTIAERSDSQVPAGSNTRLTVNKLDQVEAQVSGVSSTTMTYDAAQNIATRSVLVGTAPTGAPILSTTTYTIDEIGRVKLRVDNGLTTQYGFDPAGNLKTVIRPSTAAVHL